MFGKNNIEKQNLGDGQTLRIVEGSPWLTLQGEGPYAGRSAIFVRTHGCCLQCFFCDTNFSDPGDPVIGIDDLVSQIKKQSSGPGQLVVITGGEPLRQNIVPLCKRLWIERFTVQIETCGLYWLDKLHLFAKIVCSPKTPKIDRTMAMMADAFKYVIDHRMEFDGFIPVTNTQDSNGRKVRLASPPQGTPVYLSPCDTYDDHHNKLNHQKVVELALRYNVIAGVQLHKIFNIDEPK